MGGPRLHLRSAGNRNSHRSLAIGPSNRRADYRALSRRPNADPVRQAARTGVRRLRAASVGRHRLRERTESTMARAAVKGHQLIPLLQIAQTSIGSSKMPTLFADLWIHARLDRRLPRDGLAGAWKRRRRVVEIQSMTADPLAKPGAAPATDRPCKSAGSELLERTIARIDREFGGFASPPLVSGARATDAVSLIPSSLRPSRRPPCANDRRP